MYILFLVVPVLWETPSCSCTNGWWVHRSPPLRCSCSLCQPKLCAHIHISIYQYIWIYIHINCICRYMLFFTCIYLYVHLCVNVRICVYSYVWIWVRRNVRRRQMNVCVFAKRDMYLYNIYIYGDRSKGPCKEFYLRRPFMLCWEPLRFFPGSRK